MDENQLTAFHFVMLEGSIEQMIQRPDGGMSVTLLILLYPMSTPDTVCHSAALLKGSGRTDP